MSFPPPPGSSDDEPRYGARVPGDQPPSGPAFGEPQPPTYGETQPPAYGGTQPPAYGETQPPAYGQQQPPSYGGPGAPDPGFPQAPSPYGDPYAGSTPPAYAAAAYGGVNPSAKNALGIWALITGIVSTVTFCFWITAIPAGIAAIVTGALSLSAAKNGQANNRTLGLVGLIGGIVGIVAAIGFIVWVVSNPEFLEELQNAS